MPGMGQVIYERGIAQGMEQGIAQGIAQGMEQMVVSLVISGDITVEKAAERLNKQPEEIQKLISATSTEPK